MCCLSETVCKCSGMCVVESDRWWGVEISKCPSLVARVQVGSTLWLYTYLLPTAGFGPDNDIAI